MTYGPGRIIYLQPTTLGDHEVILRWRTPLGLWMVAADMIPRLQGYVSVGLRLYNECQTLVLEAKTDREEVLAKAYEGPLVEQRSYPTPSKIINAKK